MACCAFPAPTVDSLEGRRHTKRILNACHLRRALLDDYARPDTRRTRSYRLDANGSRPSLRYLASCYKEFRAWPTDPRASTLTSIQDALDEAGVIFLEPG